MGSVVFSEIKKTVLTTDKSYAQAEKVGRTVAENIRAHSGKHWDGTLIKVEYVGLSNIIVGDIIVGDLT